MLGISNLHAQTATAVKAKVDEKMKTKVEKDTLPLYRGLRFEMDLSPVVNCFLSDGERLTYEAGLSVNLKNKYFPTLEMGYGYADKINDAGVGFSSKAVFGRIGADINLMKQKKDQKPTNNLFFAGFRFGMAPVKYRYTNLSIPNDYWGTVITTNFLDQNTVAKWYEVLLGIRVEIVPKIYMGWTVRLKNPIGSAKLGKVYPWYIPGYGVKTEQANWGVNYAIGYKF